MSDILQGQDDDGEQRHADALLHAAAEHISRRPSRQESLAARLAACAQHDHTQGFVQLHHVGDHAKAAPHAIGAGDSNGS